MVYCSSAFVRSLASWRVLTVLFEDRLHPRPPLVPQAPGDAHHGVGGAVAVREDAGVEQVDAGRAPLVGQVYETHRVGQLIRHVFEDALHEVGVGVHDHDGVAVPARRLLRHLVPDDMVHEGLTCPCGCGRRRGGAA